MEISDGCFCAPNTHPQCILGNRPCLEVSVLHLEQEAAAPDLLAAGRHFFIQRTSISSASHLVPLSPPPATSSFLATPPHLLQLLFLFSFFPGCAANSSSPSSFSLLFRIYCLMCVCVHACWVTPPPSGWCVTATNTAPVGTFRLSG